MENLLRSVSPEFECIDRVYEANWKAGIVRDAEKDIAELLDDLETSDKDVAILRTDTEAQNAYDFFTSNGIEVRYFVSDIYEDRGRLLFGKQVLKSAEVWNRQDRIILFDCQGENSALGVPVLERYAYMGFRRNKELFVLKDYVDVPYENLKYTLKNQSILFAGDVLLSERIAWYLKKNVAAEEMFFTNILGEDVEVKEKGILRLRQVKLENIDKNVLCLVVVPQIINGMSAGKERRKEIIRILKEDGRNNYTDYFSYTRTFIALEKDMAEKGFNRECFEPNKIILGAIDGYNGNFFVKGLLDNHLSILLISDFEWLNNNLFWICVWLAGIPSERIMHLFKRIYQSESDKDLYNIELFEEKLEELLDPGEIYTSQELFVIVMIAYAYMYGRKIEDVKDMVIYWEPHYMGHSVIEEFAEWLGMTDGLCSILNVVRNICMVKGSMVKSDFAMGRREAGVSINEALYLRSEKNREDKKREVVRFEDLKLNPRKVLSELCRKWEIPWSETLMETTRYGQKCEYDNGHKKVQDFDLGPVYNNYEEYFSAFDRFRLTLLFSFRQRRYGYPYVEISDFMRRELQEMFLKEFRFEKEISYNGEKGKLDARIRKQEKMREQLWEIWKQELLEKYYGDNKALK